MLDKSGMLLYNGVGEVERFESIYFSFQTDAAIFKDLDRDKGECKLFFIKYFSGSAAIPAQGKIIGCLIKLAA